MKELNIYGWIALIAVIIGGLAWGIVGLFGFYIVTGILGEVLGRLVYIVVGVAAGYLCYLLYLDKFKRS